jgi:uncharacterized membrane protein YeaQ/YmgE (transglycosylase-associated protein family)
MNFIKFIVWLVAGAIIGWFASRMVERERRNLRVKKISYDNDG